MHPLSERMVEPYPASSMPDRDWWAALWPHPEKVLAQLGIRQA